MAITLGALRTFCAETASPDSSGSTAEREFNLWINSAVRRVYSELGWDEILHEQKINIEPEDSGSGLTVTQDSLAISLTGGETFLAAYVTDEWDLYVADDSTNLFRLSAITDSPTNTAATLRAGDQWIEASGTGKTYYFLKNRYDLPDNAKEVLGVRSLSTGYDLEYLPSYDFDRYKESWGPQRGSEPQYYTLRGKKLEIYPHPGTTRVKLGVTYRKGPPTPFTTADADATEVDWAEDWADLLEKAILVEAAITQGETAPVPYALARSEYEERLKRYKGLDNLKSKPTGPMGLMHDYPAPRYPRSVSWRING